MNDGSRVINFCLGGHEEVDVCSYYRNIADNFMPKIVYRKQAGMFENKNHSDKHAEVAIKYSGWPYIL